MSCTQKRRYETRVEAKVAAKQAQLRNPGKFHPYKCVEHNCWHIGHVQGQGQSTGLRKDRMSPSGQLQESRMGEFVPCPACSLTAGHWVYTAEVNPNNRSRARCTNCGHNVLRAS